MLMKCGNVNGGISTRGQRVLKNICENLYKRPLREERLLERIRSGKLFSYVQCDIEVPGELKKKSANFPLIFRKQM